MVSILGVKGTIPPGVSWRNKASSGKPLSKSNEKLTALAALALTPKAPKMALQINQFLDKEICIFLLFL